MRVAGRIVAWRAHGKTTFAHIADDSGRIQLYFKKDLLGESAYAALDLFDIGDVIGVRGPLFRTRTGEVTVRAPRCELLAKSLRPLPFGKEEIGRRRRRCAIRDSPIPSSGIVNAMPISPCIRRCARCFARARA